MNTVLSHIRPDRLADLCEKIGMPEEAARRIADASGSYDFSALAQPAGLLFDCRTGPEGVKEIEARTRDCENAPFIWLAVWLGAALRTKELYGRKGIADSVFYATMGCFTRFVKEHRESFGVYGFDRSYWAYRQIAMRLFRLGTLEYEMTKYTGGDAVLDGVAALARGDDILSVHIPSDARLDGENCHESYRLAEAFFGEHYPDYRYRAFYTNTWLLSPALPRLLPASSGILNFQNDYRIFSFDEDSNGYKVWVYKKPDLEPADFPENTSLQRNMKKYVLGGGRIGAAAGIAERKRFAAR